MPFYDFYLILINIFFTKIAKNRIYYLQVMTWRAGLGGELTWRAEPPCGCDVALRPRGRAMTGPRELQVARACGRRPRGMWVGIWRAHGLVGPCKKFGALTQMRYRALNFKLNILRLLFRVGLCSHMSYLLKATWTLGRRRIPSRRRRSRGPESTRSSNQARA